MIIRTNNILDVYDHYENLIKDNKKILLILDIDDTVLSSKIGVKFVDKNITKLVELAYDNLLFLTARDKSKRKYTLNQLNKCGLLHKGKYIYYNIIFSPEDNNGNSTKGIEMTKILQYKQGVDHIIFVDDELSNIDSCKKELDKLNHAYSLFHYVKKYD